MRIIPCESPNYDERKLPISMLVLHYTGMESADAARLRLCDPTAKVSAHYMVDELGLVFSLIDENKRAWHAGVSAWRNITDINSASIGIEIVNGGHDFGLPEYPDRQIRAVIALCADILTRHIVNPFDIVAHSDIAPSRKQDPGEKFPWPRLASNGIGVWPQPGPFNQTPFAPTNLDGQWRSIVIRALESLGYVLTPDNFLDVLTALQRRYRPRLVNGVLDVQTLRIIFRLRLLVKEDGSTTKVG